MRVSLQKFVRPLDGILYEGWSLISTLIKVRTFSRYSHGELVTADPARVTRPAFASRNFIGVGIYPLRVEDASLVLRPKFDCDLEKIRAWIFSRDEENKPVVLGQGYDFRGIFVFLYLARHGRRDAMFCFEAMTRAWRRGGGTPIHPSVDADHVSGGTLASSPFFDHFQVQNGHVTI